MSFNVASSLLADAFLHYPLMLHAFQGLTEQERHLKLLKLYNRCSQACHQYGGSLITPQSEGALIWLPGTAFPLGLMRELKSGMGFLPFELGLRSTLRLVQHDSVPEGWIRDHAGKQMGYIWCVGVSEAHRGKGISRILIDESILQMQQQGINEFWLKTDDPKNVPIYKALGFEVMYETVVPSSGLQTWCFRKK